MSKSRTKEVDLVSPLYSSIFNMLNDGADWMVGFDDILKKMAKRFDDNFDGFVEYPASNIKKIGDSHYEIDMAVAGYQKPEISIEVNDGRITVSGEHKEEKEKEEGEYISQEFKGRSFKKTFLLSEYDTVKKAKLEHGILSIDIDRKIPEAKRPTAIEIE